ncbi:M48 family metallopeptidase [Piscinibacter gummiphilus]|uniref:Peptidase M48 n=1 Tax=Piscinibacter gummiphilus TaxID=946333 RepID=A0A1W6LBN8_9BURK|nr:M48 family metallopeptidase [Piscinibacter gummiphilus]ARN21654.1 peptidase M48 [Piscinibacter gummiphilus]ATU66343.1 peptidase M48 [Piscinibacter gummiphilus]GLS95778.1 peptidase [Piscinibacter gummiphilus]
MESIVLSGLFAVALLASLLVKFWLATRQMRHVVRHRGAVPAAFAGSVSLAAHQKAADYTVAKGRLGLLATAFSAAVLLGWTLLGGLDALNTVVRDAVFPRFGGLAYQVALVLAFSAISGLLDLPFELYATFRLEQRFGFNRMTWKLYVVDTLKGIGLGLAFGVPIIALILWIMGAAGAAWWLWAWGAWMGIILVARVIYPIVISPVFNKFEPLADEALKERIQGLMTRCGFRAKGLFVMDGSLRSAHGNAYFTGLGASKRVVFFDTLLNKLAPGEVEAVLAHELGHFKLRHLLKMMLLSFATSLAGFALLGWLSAKVWFYSGLGAGVALDAPNDALALLLFLLVVPVFGFFVSPLMSQLSRRHEFEADAYACAQANGNDLAAALLKLHEDNAATLTPDPLYVRFWYSHPPASERIAALRLQTG